MDPNHRESLERLRDQLAKPDPEADRAADDRDKEYRRLKDRWVNLRSIIDTAVNPPNWADREEQEAWDEWVDWVEANELNGTFWDPRGPEDEMVTVLDWVR
jgi:hypothetical protein